MKKIFNRVLIVFGLIGAGLFVLGTAYVVLFGIKDGKAIVGKIKTVNGKVKHIYDAGSYDIGFSLEDNDNRYYINRGQQYGLNLQLLKDVYTGKDLEISFVSQFGLEGGHISRVVHADSMVYNELKD